MSQPKGDPPDSNSPPVSASEPSDSMLGAPPPKSDCGADAHPTIAVPTGGPALRAVLNHRLSENFSELVATARLAPREIEVLRAFFTGRSTQQVAERLHISVSTVKAHVRHILAKTGAESTRDLYLDLLVRVWDSDHIELG